MIYVGIDVAMDKHYESALFRINPRLKVLRDLKEEYIRFNTRNAGLPARAAEEIEDVIDHYLHSDDSIFTGFAGLLCKFKEPILNSFIMVEKNGPGGIYNSRLSNGPIESLTRKVKDLKRLGRGFRHFKHFRNRFLYATRDNPVLYGASDSSQVQYYGEDDKI